MKWNEMKCANFKCVHNSPNSAPHWINMSSLDPLSPFWYKHLYLYIFNSFFLCPRRGYFGPLWPIYLNTESHLCYAKTHSFNQMMLFFFHWNISNISARRCCHLRKIVQIRDKNLHKNIMDKYKKLSTTFSACMNEKRGDLMRLSNLLDFLSNWR